MAAGSRATLAQPAPQPRAIHLVIQPKGGAGKSFIAALMAEYLRAKGRLGLCLDLDVSNQTFTDYKEFAVRRIELIEGRKVDQRKFDAFFELLLGSENDTVVDTGANTYHPLAAYLQEERFIDNLVDDGFEVVLHVPVTSAVTETLEGLIDISKAFPEREGVSIIVWANKTFGPIEKSGMPLFNMKAYTDLDEAKRITAEISLEKLDESTGETAVREAIRTRRSLQACAEDPTIPTTQRWRYKRIAGDLYKEIDKAGIA